MTISHSFNYINLLLSLLTTEAPSTSREIIKSIYKKIEKPLRHRRKVYKSQRVERELIDPKNGICNGTALLKIDWANTFIFERRVRTLSEFLRSSDQNGIHTFVFHARGLEYPDIINYKAIYFQGYLKVKSIW